MCLALPARILSVEPDVQEAVVELGGVKKRVSTMLLDDLAVGDFVIIHVGYALNKLDQLEAERTLSAIAALEGKA